MYVIKTPYGAYVNQFDDGEIYLALVDFESANKYSKKQVQKIYKKNKKKWQNNNWQVFNVVESDSPCSDWR